MIQCEAVHITRNKGIACKIILQLSFAHLNQQNEGIIVTGFWKTYLFGT